jgi:hypothetical protein
MAEQTAGYNHSRLWDNESKFTPKLPPEGMPRCEATDPQHPYIQCVKLEWHSGVVHEGFDSSGEVLHSWTQHVKGMVIANLPEMTEE